MKPLKMDVTLKYECSKGAGLITSMDIAIKDFVPASKEVFDYLIKELERLRDLQNSSVINPQS